MIPVPLRLPALQTHSCKDNSYEDAHECLRCSYNAGDMLCQCSSDDHKDLKGHNDINCAYRLVFTFMIDMDEAPIDVGQILQLVLQVLRNVMSFPQRHLPIEHDIDFDMVFWARVTNATAVDRLDIAVECHGLEEVQSARLEISRHRNTYLINDQLLEVDWSCDTRKKLELFC